MTLIRWVSLAGLCLSVAGCPHDLTRRGADAGAMPDSAQLDGDTGGDAARRDGAPADARQDGPRPDGPAPDTRADMSPHDLGNPCKGQNCVFGCNHKLKRCNRLRPSNIGVGAFFDKLSLTLSSKVGAGPMVIDTDTGSIKQGASTHRPGNKSGVYGGTYWAVVAQPAGVPGLSVIALDSLRVTKGTKLLVEGSRALAIYTRAGLDIEGEVVLPAAGFKAGAGGRKGGVAGTNGVTCYGGEGRHGLNSSSVARATGGGGGGRGGPGGSGGYAGSLLGGKGGITHGAANLTPLYGGCGGGAGEGRHANLGGLGGMGGSGGGGGGALQLSTNGNLTISGSINTGGAGGGGAPYNGGGGGGGSGGAILLEAAWVKVTGEVAANGGGGGSGAGSVKGKDGNHGLLGAQVAGGGQGFAAGSGGNGGGLKAGNGSPGYGYTSYSGGAGGGVGRIRINAPNVTITGSDRISPLPSKSSKPGTW